MKTLNSYITERLHITKKTGVQTYKYFPQNNYDLVKILEDKLKEDKNANLNDINVSNITKMPYLFQYLDPYNIDISQWDVSNVTDMRYMFDGCKNFDSDLSDWDVSNVTNMNGIFEGCKKFTGKGLENWDVSNVKDMKRIFLNCDSLKNKPSWYKE